MARKYKSRISAAVHESMSDLHEIGLIAKRTMREFDQSCLTRAAPAGVECSRGWRGNGGCG
jgi:putative transcriptional regulator